MSPRRGEIGLHTRQAGRAVSSSSRMAGPAAFSRAAGPARSRERAGLDDSAGPAAFTGPVMPAGTVGSHGGARLGDSAGRLWDVSTPGVFPAVMAPARMRGFTS